MHGFMEQNQPVKVQRVITVAGFGQQVQSLPQSFSEVGFAGDRL